MLFRLINLIVNLVKSKKFEIFLKKINKINKHKNFGLKKRIVLFEFTSMFTTHITYSHLVWPMKRAYNSKAYGITTSLLSKKKINIIQITRFI